MKASTVLLLVTLCTGAARGALEGGCGRAGALRCDADGRHVSACTKGGAWRRVLDCGASHGTCVDGRCVGAASASPRADPCSNPGEWGCSSDCVYRTICTSNLVWAEVSPCPARYICDCGECVESATKTCRYSDVPICGQGSRDQFFPDIDNCSRAYACFREGEPAIPAEVCTVEPDIYFQPCAQDCVSTSSICDRYQSCNGNEGLDAVIPGNPSLHYICANGTMFLMKCVGSTSIYDPIKGECVDAGYEYCRRNRMDMNTFSKIVRFDECSSTDSSTSTDVSTNPTDDSTSPTDDSTTTTDGTPTPSRPCIVGDKWADLEDECKFYYCYPPGEPIHMTCPPNSKYDATVASCVSASGLCLR